jgi:hypothetical protein
MVTDETHRLLAKKRLNGVSREVHERSDGEQGQGGQSGPEHGAAQDALGEASTGRRPHDTLSSPRVMRR